MARAGLASRRRAEEMIRSGLVTVNGRIVTELGTKADEAKDHIKVAGKLLRPVSERVYLLLHKPPEVVATLSDPEGRASLRDLLGGVPERVFPVGRLEYHSTGLVFLTSDGDLANRILKAHHLQQTYQLKVKNLLTFAEIEALARSTGARISRIRGKETPWYQATLSEARRDALRNRLFQTGHPVEKIRRTAIANLELGSLAPGQYRAVTAGELVALNQLLDRKVTPLKLASPKRPVAPKPFVPKRPFVAKRPSASNRPVATKRPVAPRRPSGKPYRFPRNGSPRSPKS